MMNWIHEERPSRVFATRDEVRRFARRNNLPQARILNTLGSVNSGYDGDTLYNVAPDGSWDVAENGPRWFATKRRQHTEDHE